MNRARASHVDASIKDRRRPLEPQFHSQRGLLTVDGAAKARSAIAREAERVHMIRLAVSGSGEG